MASTSHRAPSPFRVHQLEILITSFRKPAGGAAPPTSVKDSLLPEEEIERRRQLAARRSLMSGCRVG